MKTDIVVPLVYDTVQSGEYQKFRMNKLPPSSGKNEGSVDMKTHY